MGKMQMYGIPGTGVSTVNFTDYTAEFLLTRGPYAMLGYSWVGCTDGQQFRARAKEWDMDFGEPVDGAACAETGADSGIFERKRARPQCSGIAPRATVRFQQM